MPGSFHFQFGSYSSYVSIEEKFNPDDFLDRLGYNDCAPVLAVCDENTASLTREIFDRAGAKAEMNKKNAAFFQLPAGEQHKNWSSIEAIIRAAREAGLGRDGRFIGVGGGVICDLTAFAASIYMRGAFLALVPTTLLCMADAALGGKTGINLDGVKNMAGTFYPAGNIVIAAEALNSLPAQEWKNGIAELIKTAIIDPDPSFLNGLRQLTVTLKGQLEANNTLPPQEFLPFIEKAVLTKGRIAESDPAENINNKDGRALLNLGHSFGHALESACLSGTISHGQAIAWGMAKACELGLELGITPPDRADLILQILSAWGFETSNSFLENNDNTRRNFFRALMYDKKKKAGRLRFVIPSCSGAVLIEENDRVTNYIHTL